MISYKHAIVDANRIFYREAGSATAPTILLLHGFPTSSHMFRNVVPALADGYHVVAPDLPGFGFSDTPDMVSRTNRKWHPSPIHWIPPFWRVPVMTRFNLTCSSITRATSHSTQNSRSISGASGLRYSRSGAKRSVLSATRAEAFRRDNTNAEVRFYDTGHFALETHHREIAGAIRDFLSRRLALKAATACRFA